MTRRTITVTLTEQQYRMLGGAVAHAENDWWEHAGEGDGKARRDAVTLGRAWRKINIAWYDRERPRR